MNIFLFWTSLVHTRKTGGPKRKGQSWRATLYITSSPSPPGAHFEFWRGAKLASHPADVDLDVDVNFDGNENENVDADVDLDVVVDVGVDSDADSDAMGARTPTMGLDQCSRDGVSGYKLNKN